MDLAADKASHRSRWSLGTGMAGFGLLPITCPVNQRDLLVARRMGKIVIEAGRLRAVYGRWWPHQGDLWQVFWDRSFRTITSDVCELYYQESWGTSGFLTLSYVRSGPRTSLGSFYAATLLLDEIASLKRANAIVCHVTNARISHRLMLRWGWQQHCLNWSGRHYIKRFYGDYPSIPDFWRERLALGRRISGARRSPSDCQPELPLSSHSCN